MLKLDGKHRNRVSNRTALFAAALLAVSTAVSLQGNESDIQGDLMDHPPGEFGAAAPSEPAGEAATKKRKLNLKFVLFRHG